MALFLKSSTDPRKLVVLSSRTAPWLAERCKGAKGFAVPMPTRWLRGSMVSVLVSSVSGALNAQLPPLGRLTLGTAPVSWLPGTKPVTLAAVTAWGAAVIFWRGVSAVNAPAPLVRASNCNQRSAPVNTPAPGSTVTVNSPLLTRMPG
ncbi:MAG: hypothetical protein BWX84_00205 [Verrucomicrobia bacterium ADurb.Bin118]|nr:MAG: hypothetical protein BWX84_00205 [Verrucomicrobia bacterium ADurb.Bin118]